MSRKNEASTSKQWYQNRGLQRRNELLRALRELLQEKEISQIRYQEVADRAGIPLPSCYNLFKGKANLLQGLTEYYAPLFNQTVFEPLEADAIPEEWTGLVNVMVDRAVAFIDDNIAARRVWFGFDIPAEVSASTRHREKSTAIAYREFVSRYFELPAIRNLDEYFYLALEIADRIMQVAEFSDPKLRSFYITEAKRAQSAYLSVHIPLSLSRKLKT